MIDWKLNGTYFETCNCAAACPCVFLSAPSEGECTALVAWHIERGHYGNTALDGLNVALAVYTPGNMSDGKWKAAAYFDAKASEEQNEALHTIFGGKAGGHPELLASFVGEMVGARSVPMRFHSDGNTSSLSIQGVAEADIERLEGQGGQPITISNHPLCVAPGKAATVARSKRFNLKDFGWDWSASGRNGFSSPFEYAAAG